MLMALVTLGIIAVIKSSELLPVLLTDASNKGPDRHLTLKNAFRLKLQT